jgi:PAS domain S-box-containing protein
MDVETVLEHLRDYAIFMVHADGRVATWNGGAEHLFGYAAHEILGQPVHVLFTPDDRAREVAREDAEIAIRRGLAEGDRWHVRKDGSLLFGAATLRPVRDDTGDVTGFVKIVRDITERRQAAQALAERERLLREATEANRIKDDFLSTVSHELRTPLNAVLGWTQLVRQGRLSVDGGISPI